MPARHRRRLLRGPDGELYDALHEGKTLCDLVNLVSDTWSLEVARTNAQGHTPRARGPRSMDWAGLANQEPPPRTWLIDHWLPPQPTLFAGRGGLGKSFLAQMIATALAVGVDFVAAIPERVNVLVWSCEDDADEIWRRQAAICGYFGIPIESLAGRLHIVPRMGEDNTLLGMAYGEPTWTPLIDGLREQVGDCKARVVILDKLSHLFGGNESSLELWRAHPDHDRCTIAVCSDHAQVSAQRRVRVKEQMRSDGLQVGAALSAETVFAGSTGYYGAVRVAGGDPRRVAALPDWLNQQSWCGNVFTPNGDGVRGSVPGTLDRALLMLEHARTPEVYYTMRAEEAPNAWGLPGTCWFDSSEIPDGGGTHGGLHRIEMNNLLALQGGRLRQGYRSRWPASQTDPSPSTRCPSIP